MGSGEGDAKGGMSSPREIGQGGPGRKKRIADENVQLKVVRAVSRWHSLYIPVMQDAR